MQNASFSAGIVALLASPALSGVNPEPVGHMTLNCEYHSSCFVQLGDTFSKCSEQQPALLVTILVEGNTARVQKPNGSVELGFAARFAEYSDLPYVVVGTGDGAGTSMISIFPDNSSIWTGHFTLYNNASDSSFGHCEVLN